jgi:hypothetical protein
LISSLILKIFIPLELLSAARIGFSVWVFSSQIRQLAQSPSSKIAVGNGFHRKKLKSSAAENYFGTARILPKISISRDVQKLKISIFISYQLSVISHRLSNSGVD